MMYRNYGLIFLVMSFMNTAYSSENSCKGIMHEISTVNGMTKIFCMEEVSKGRYSENGIFILKKDHVVIFSTYSKNGLFHGKSISWNDTGNKISEGSYVNGQRDGIWMFWDSDGVLLNKVIYEFGKTEQ